jgi:hypothetical protein
MADSYRAIQYIRTNYRRTGSHFDYGEVCGILNKTFTFCGSAYYTALNNIFASELGGSTVVVSARVAWVHALAGTHKYTSVVGAAKNEMSYNVQINAYVSYTASSPSMLVILYEWKKETVSTMLADAGETFGTEVTFFVVSR